MKPSALVARLLEVKTRPLECRARLPLRVYLTIFPDHSVSFHCDDCRIRNRNSRGHLGDFKIEHEELLFQLIDSYVRLYSPVLLTYVNVCRTFRRQGLALILTIAFFIVVFYEIIGDLYISFTINFNHTRKQMSLVEFKKLLCSSHFLCRNAYYRTLL